ncbi:hypothetical protein F5B21DRAFT_498256 [Xylaria acuta]|nr:hypothetical protein F5B21DRAFT_498256 [Xylaria acuta]
MRTSVHPNYRETHMKALDTIDQWYDNLWELGSSGRLVLKLRCKHDYKELIRRAEGSRIRNLVKWADEWLNKVTRVYREGGKIEAIELITDLEKALRNTHSEWTTVFRSQHSTEIWDNTLRYQDIATSLREEASVLSFTRTASKLAPSAFSILGAEAQEDNEPVSHTGDDHLYEPAEESESLSRASTKRARADTDPALETCDFCYGEHLTMKCWYALPELRPDHWEPNPTREKIVRVRVAKEEGLGHSIKRIRSQLNNP